LAAPEAISNLLGKRMRVAIVGFGKMGREIEAMAARRGHHVVWTLSRTDNASGAGLTAERLAEADAVFEFTAPDSAVENLLALARSGATVICGTTGWQRDLPRIAEAFERGGGALVHATNFSVGVRLFFETARAAAELFPRAGYAAYVVEEHHAEKRDAPSGTAKTLAGVVREASGAGVAPPISSVRAGTIPGTHRLVFESPEDEVELVHRARGRAGFAKGAVWAAERVCVAGRRGVFEFGELLKEVS
jgi:4-hydroxy-tetrahydrodipicolinate reductase